jgi:DNA polymerase III subunit delta'
VRLADHPEAQRLLAAALAEGPAHAYLFHGPAGVGKRRAALSFAAELIGERERVERRTHPDLYLLEPLGDQIRIDDIRALRRDLHLRPFEAARRVYLVLSAELMNEDAADALLKDLEEPPEYATLVLVADELGPLPETIRSRCQPVPFQRLSERAVRQWIATRAPALPPGEVTALARVAGGRLDRAARLLDPQAAERRAALLGVARATYADDEFDASEAAQVLLDAAARRGRETREAEEEVLEHLDVPPREAEQRLRRAERGGERDELLLMLDELGAWYRDLVAVGAGAERVAVHADRLEELREDATPERAAAAEEAVELVREAWRAFEELNVQAWLALEALLIQLRRTLAARAPATR